MRSCPDTDIDPNVTGHVLIKIHRRTERERQSGRWLGCVDSTEARYNQGTERKGPLRYVNSINAFHTYLFERMFVSETSPGREGLARCDVLSTNNIMAYSLKIGSVVEKDSNK